MGDEESYQQERHDPTRKGLRAETVGLIGAIVIGVSCIAPAYTLTAALGPIAAKVGSQAPAIILVGFLPMLLVAFGYRELNSAMPDSGTSFTWVTRGVRAVDRLAGRLGTGRVHRHCALQYRRRGGGLLLSPDCAGRRQSANLETLPATCR